jgi:diguanylate cyclase (GGDEF)-like protein
MRFVGIWPLFAIVAIGFLWHLTFKRIDADKDALNRAALKEAGSIAQNYEHHLTRAIEQIDQITQYIQYQWLQEGGRLKLEELLQVSIFPASLLNYVAVIDRNGTPVTSTISIRAVLPATSADYFLFHQRDKSQDLRISEPEPSQISGKPVIQFTRRLDAQDGSFNGVVLVSVETSTLSSFYGGANMGKLGLLAIVGRDNVVRMAKIGNSGSGEVMPVLRKIPQSSAAGGAVLLKGDQWFVDDKTRFVGWQALTNYPLIVLAGLAEEEVLTSHQAAWRNYKDSAVIGSLVVLLFGLTGSALSMRLAWRKHQADEIRDSYRLATESGEEGFFRVRAIYDKHDRNHIVDFIVEDSNERGAAFFQRTRAQMIGSKFSELAKENERDAIMHIYREAMQSGFHDGDFAVAPNSLVQAAWIHRRLVRSGSGLAVTIRDISHTKAHERALSQMANEDALTRLPNRYWLMHSLPEKLKQAAQNNTMLALLFMDLNKFKSINDTWGHAVGDELLHAVALRLKGALRPTDNIVRLGGDEFVVLLEPIVNKEDAADVAERIADTFIEPFKLSPGKKSVNASIGISLFPNDGDNVEALLKNADMAMYSCKVVSKARYCFYEAELDYKLRARREIEQALLDAVEQDQFVLYYQPRVDAVTCELRSMEALVRWIHPQRGLLEPLEFIVLAESTGIIVKLGELVMEKACAQIACWKLQQLHVVPVSINVSARQFNQGDVRQHFVKSIARHDIEPGLVELEITESSMMGEQAEVDAQLIALRQSGIKLLIDDFGTGYSSLSQLQRLDMDLLKVDQAFTAQLGRTERGEIFFRAIVSMAHALGMKVVAEGVETLKQFQMLQELSCDEIQGFFISKPVPANEMSALMRKRSLLPVAAD